MLNMKILSLLSKNLRALKGSIVGLLTGILLIPFCSSSQNRINNPWRIADSDSVWFSSNNVSSPIHGAVFKAINPKYIANMHGFTKSEYFVSNYSDSIRTYEKHSRKSFSLIDFNPGNSPNYNFSALITSLNAQKKWNYYINDALLAFEQRALVSALMLQAIEKIEFSSTDTTHRLAVDPGFPIAIPHSPYSQGAIRFYTRDITKKTINERKTVYLLNDDLVISRKFYEAINPVFIRSLNRITGQAEIKKYGLRKGINEIVKISLFKRGEVIGAILTNDCPDCHVFLVDNIQIGVEIYLILNNLYFKEISDITEDDEKAFAPYIDRFPKGKLSGKKAITIIAL